MELIQPDNLCDELIYSYSRAQALADGVLIDVTELAKEAGFKIPVAVTRVVWEHYIEWTDEDSKTQTTQDTIGRLWDVLWMLYAARKHAGDESFVCYKLRIVPRDGYSKSPILVKLKSVIGVGDNGEPVITIMLPHED